jgi:membrane fusion protein (multidrug efflux system)
MANTNDQRPEAVQEARATIPQPNSPDVRPSAPHQAADGAIPVTTHPPLSKPWRKWLLLGLIAAGLAIAAYFVIPIVYTMLITVSTDDAYVNGHVTFVAPRVAGQVTKVLVDDNYRVKAGDLLVQLDKEPYLDQVAIKKAAVEAAEADLIAANAQARGLAAQTRANAFKLDHSIEDVNTQIANLRAAVATYDSKKATLVLARANLKRGEELAPSGGVSKEDLDQRRQQVKVGEAAVEQALQAIYAIRVSLGLPARPPKYALHAGVGLPAQLPPDQLLADVPPDLDQNFSVVREALATTLQSAAQLGIFPTSWNATPKQVREEFYRREASGNLDKIYAQAIEKAPTIKQAQAKLLQAKADLVQAELNLRYCDIVSEIDGVVTRRNVNPGNNVQVGQSLMAVRSLTEIWIDANFKETQLSYLRIGQRVRCEVDMYGSRREFEGRITGFTMGTGQTLALLPPQNATGNFVKIVQRLPVRIELTDYDPDKVPLFVGLSVEPCVYYKEKPEGPDAGKMLQPFAPLPRLPTEPKSN